MNRRDFLRRLTVGGIAATTAVREWPFRVFSFPQEIKIAPPILFPWDPEQVRVRFIRAFDPIQSKMVNRWDVVYGFMKLDEANRAYFVKDGFGFKDADGIKIASPEEARKLGLVDPRYADALDYVAKGEDSECEITAIAPPQRFIERFKLGPARYTAECEIGEPEES